MKYAMKIENNVLISYDGPVFGSDKVVIVPDGVTAIGKRAFWYNRDIEEIILPESVESIGEEAFGMCNGLKRITMPSHMTTIETRAFCYCSALETIRIPRGVTEIPSEAFYDCDKLKRVTFPAGLTAVGFEAFHGCYVFSQLLFEGTQAEWAGVYKSYRWAGPSLMLAVVCTGFDEKTDKNNPEDFVIENGVLKKYKGNDSTVIVPDGVVRIASHAFFKLMVESSLYRVILPEGLNQIDENAFNGNRQLSEIVIPVSLKKVDLYAFFGCYAAKKIIYRGTRAQWAEIDRDINISSIKTVECTDGIY